MNEEELTIADYDDSLSILVEVVEIFIVDEGSA